MIGRRDFIIGSASLLFSASLLPTAGSALAALPVPVNKRLAFQVMRKGSQIGTHVLSFDQSGDNLVVNVAVDLVIKLGPIPIFRYRHYATETWASGTVISIVASTDDDGDKLQVSGKRSEQDNGLVVQGTKFKQYLAPYNALPATHWNRRMLSGPMINTQNGKLMHPEVTPLGTDTIPTSSNEIIRAKHYRLSGDAKLDTWYDEKPTWSGLSFLAEDGSAVRYLKM